MEDRGRCKTFGKDGLNSILKNLESQTKNNTTSFFLFSAPPESTIEVFIEDLQSLKNNLDQTE